jgi:hypothetical protein
MDDTLTTLIRFAKEALPVSVLGWLGLRMGAWSLGQAQKPVRLGGPIAFLVLWGFAIFVRSSLDAGASSILSTLYVSFFALGSLAVLVRLLVRAFTRPSKRQ